MSWHISYKKTFLKELAALPKGIQEHIENIAFNELLTENPFALGIVEKMKGYGNKFKVRYGDYRLGLTIDKKNKAIICERCAHRSKIYKIFP